MKERRDKGLCYYCDDKWLLGHKCKSPKLYLLSGLKLPQDEGPDDIYYDTADSAEPVPEFNVVECKEPEISLNAISGSSGLKSMRLLGLLHAQQVSILVDSGSTHNFLDPCLLPRVQLWVTSTPLLHVKIANGDSIICLGKVEVVSLKVQGHSILTDFYIIALGGCDIVLGVQWLKTLGPVLWDFSRMTVQYTHLEIPTLLMGLSSTAFSMEGAHFLKPSSSANKGLLLKLICDLEEATPSYPPEIQSILTTFKAAFAEPLGLPPSRPQDHTITLQHTQPINVRSYRYPFYQKYELEKIIRELLLSGVI